MDATVLAEPHRRAFTLDDGEVAALEFGEPSSPVDILFSHANGFNALTYRTILAPLSPSRHIIALDQRGHGWTRLPAVTEGRVSWDDLVDDLVAVIDQIETPKVVLSGHSMGGTVSLLAAARRPDRVKGLVLFDPVIMPLAWSLLVASPFASHETMKKAPIAVRAAQRRPHFPSAEEAFKAYRGRGAFKSWPDAILADYVTAGFRQRGDGEVELACAPEWEASNFGSQKNHVWSRARKVRAPITILRAEHGSTCRIGSGALFLFGKKARLTTVEGTTHFLPMERPDLVRQALMDASA